MPSLRSLLCSLAIFCFSLDQCVADRYVIHQRDDSTSTTSTSLPSVSPSKSTQSGNSPSDGTSTTVTHPSSSTDISKTALNSTTNFTTSVSTTSSSATNSAVPTLLFNDTIDPDELPIQPELTPGFGVAGVLLILTGVVYALIGIRNRMLQIAVSATYLGALSVTVLIIYVLSLPVSNAIQGAYVVAAVVTGMILGGASLLFQEMTEGLGCLFGGFCFSMWLLVLVPGGLLKGTGPIAIFIACFTVAGYATSFNRFTRPYGIIGLTSFGGGTASVIGFDCFSRAGLKEFWAYIWNLNGNLFPFGATTYPLTRGMKVEIAAIVVIFLAGLVSQSKLWKLVKSRRESRARERLDDERNLQKEEEGVGRRIQFLNTREQAEWEAVYGDKDIPKSSTPGICELGEETKKGSQSSITTIRNSRDGIEMADMPPTPPEITNGLVTTSGNNVGIVVNVVADDEAAAEVVEKEAEVVEKEAEVVEKEAEGNLPIINPYHHSTNAPGSVEANIVGSDGEPHRSLSRTKSNQKFDAPSIIPLPFNVTEGEVADDRSSVATFADDDNINGRSKRFSGASALLQSISNRTQQHRLSRPISVSTEQLVPSEAGDRSSVAATIDDLTDNDDCDSLPEETTPEDLENFSSHSSGNPTDHKPSSLSRVALENNDLQEIAPTAAAQNLKDPLPEPVQDESQTEFRQPVESEAAASVAEQIPKPTILSKESLPPMASRVVTSYRTNEWAKHLSNAEMPVYDDLQLSHSPLTSSPEVQEEPLAPLDVVELSQTAETGHVRPAARRAVSQTPTINTRSPVSPLGLGIGIPPQTPNLSRSSSQQSLQSGSHRVHRTPSPNIGPTLIESAAEDDATPLPLTSTPYGSNTTLINKRSTIVRSRSSLTGSFPTTHPPTPQTSSYNAQDSRLDDENISLGARRSIIRQSHLGFQHTPSPPSPPLSSHAAARRSVTTPMLYQPTHDSHRDSQFSKWRSSMQDLRASVSATELNRASPVVPMPQSQLRQIERQRSMLWAERVAAEEQARKKEAKKRERDSVFNSRMRNGDMLGAHKEAMRRLQGEAKGL